MNANPLIRKPSPRYPVALIWGCRLVGRLAPNPSLSCWPRSTAARSNRRSPTREPVPSRPVSEPLSTILLVAASGGAGGQGRRPRNERPAADEAVERRPAGAGGSPPRRCRRRKTGRRSLHRWRPTPSAKPSVRLSEGQGLRLRLARRKRYAEALAKRASCEAAGPRSIRRRHASMQRRSSRVAPSSMHRSTAPY